MNNKPIVTSLIVVVVFVLGGCSDSGDRGAATGAATSGPQAAITPVEKLQFRLLDRFDIGENIYARSVLAQGDTLWVGTSAGLMEISLDEYLPRKIYTRDDGNFFSGTRPG